VSENHKKDGILAWRKIVDPSNDSRATYLPIYDPEVFTPEQRAKIPQPGDDEHPELYLDYSNAVYKIAVAWRELDETPMAWGPAGVGKTEIARHLAYLMQAPFERFSITASTELDELAGKMRFSPEKGMYFEYGRLPKAWASRCVILIDEPNVGPPDVWQFLRPLTDNSKQLVLDASSGENVVRSDHTYLLMAANPSWDPRNIAANSIGDADSSRLYHIRFNLPPENLEKKIIAARIELDGWEIPEDQLRQMMQAANDIRQMSDDGTLPITWGLRTQIKVARALKWFSPLSAYKLATDDLEPAVQTIILDSVKSLFGDDGE
jgi:MoxR-like ATPase